MKSKKQYPTKYYIRFITWLLFNLFSFVFRIKKKMPAEVKELKPPYLVLGNHVGYWDPFVTGNFLPHFVHFVSSDTAFRNPFNRFFLSRLGTIPKKKNVRDTQVIRDIVSVIRQGENVGIFAEAVRNWAGSSLKMDTSIVKLVKLLNVPVVVPVLKGMNLFNPRWSPKLRYTRVEVEYKLLFRTEDYKKLADEEIFVRLSDAMKHDELEYQRGVMNKIHSKHKAENINHALYVCPQCHAIDCFIVSGNNFECSGCGYDIHIDDYGFFERITKGKLFFDNIRDWYYWEEEWLLQKVSAYFDNNYTGVIFEDQNSAFYETDENDEVVFIDTVNLKLYIDRIEIDLINKKERISLNFNDLQTINPQVNDRLEILYNNKAYRAVGQHPGVSALKWEVALNAIWNELGQKHKLSAFIEMD